MLSLKKTRMLLSTSLVVSCLIIFSNNISAEEPSNVIHTIGQNAIENLNMGIQSENHGLRKSAIELAGKRVIKETAGALLKQLEVEKSPELRIAILRSLYIIGNDKFLKDIYKIASYDEDSNVRKMASAIYIMMQVNNSVTVAELKN